MRADTNFKGSDSSGPTVIPYTVVESRLSHLRLDNLNQHFLLNTANNTWTTLSYSQLLINPLIENNRLGDDDDEKDNFIKV